MKSAKECGVFPYRSKLNCYFEVCKDGKVSQIPHINKCDAAYVAQAYKRALNGQSKIFAVWPGNYRSDLFEIDDLNAFAAAFGIDDSKVDNS